jgi:hypothetical protein
LVEGERIRIDGPSDVLEGLRQSLIAAAGDGVEIEPVATGVPGELREPLLVGMIITSTGVSIKTIGDVVMRYMQHLERKEELRIIRESNREEISVAELQQLDEL